jgi:hypothetical protein
MLGDSRCAALIFLPTTIIEQPVFPMFRDIPQDNSESTPLSKKENTLRLWLAHDKGEIWDVAVPSTEILDRRTVHSARVTHLLRCEHSILSIDEAGNLKIWSPDSTVYSIVLILGESVTWEWTNDTTNCPKDICCDGHSIQDPLVLSTSHKINPSL